MPYDVAAAVAGPLGAHSSLLKLIKILLQPFKQPVFETSIFIKRCSLLAGGEGEGGRNTPSKASSLARGHNAVRGPAAIGKSARASAVFLLTLITSRPPPKNTAMVCPRYLGMLASRLQPCPRVYPGLPGIRVYPDLGVLREAVAVH